MKLKTIAQSSLFFAAILLFVGLSAVQGSVATKPSETVVAERVPVEKRWTETIDGKVVRFMTIDGIMVHETDTTKQPLPKVVTPGTASTQDKSGTAPSDAIVLFDGTKASMDNWHGTRPKHPNNDWNLLDDGSMEAVRQAGSIKSKQKFGSCQLHIEWMAPNPPKGEGQGRGNSGVFLMDNYEVQILDSYNDVSTTYADGQAGALYGRKKPDFNACRKPGEWQTYDILFKRPLFDEEGNVIRRAEFVVLHNGVFIQNTTLFGGTGWDGPHAATDYKKHADALPIQLQSHGSPVRFRNIWIRPLED
ncbi:MAG: DUF1080 domain-containing protein [Phycisphaeraceae bacterium]